MKSTNLFRLTFLILAIIGLSWAGCKKDKNTEPSSDSSSLQQLAGDEETMESSMDESMNEINNFLSGGILKSTAFLPCNATVDSTPVVNDTITIYITYNGLNCLGTRYRTGQVEIKKRVGTQWSQPGATVIVKHINFSISKILESTFITINGVKVYQNVSGGLIRQLGTELNTVVYRTWGQAIININDSTNKTWNIAHQITYSGSLPDNLSLTSDGFGTAGGYENLVTWGINRQGENFYTQIIQPVTRYIQGMHHREN